MGKYLKSYNLFLDLANLDSFWAICGECNEPLKYPREKSLFIHTSPCREKPKCAMFSKPLECNSASRYVAGEIPCRLVKSLSGFPYTLKTVQEFGLLARYTKEAKRRPLLVKPKNFTSFALNFASNVLGELIGPKPKRYNPLKTAFSCGRSSKKFSVILNPFSLAPDITNLCDRWYL